MFFHYFVSSVAHSEETDAYSFVSIDCGSHDNSLLLRRASQRSSVNSQEFQTNVIFAIKIAYFREPRADKAGSDGTYVPPQAPETMHLRFYRTAWVRMPIEQSAWNVLGRAWNFILLNLKWLNRDTDLFNKSQIYYSIWFHCQQANNVFARNITNFPQRIFGTKMVRMQISLATTDGMHVVKLRYIIQTA